jgi:hypothetical protein
MGFRKWISAYPVINDKIRSEYRDGIKMEARQKRLKSMTEAASWILLKEKWK